MKRVLFLMLVISGVLLFGTHPAQAFSYKVDFTAAGFETGAPIDPVSGTIYYNAASATADINSLSSIDLTINGYKYLFGEIEFNNLDGWRQIGGKLYGINGMDHFTNDFILEWYKDLSVNSDMLFGYTTEQYGGSWGSRTFTNFSVTESTPTPIPGALVLFGSGLIGLVGIGRKRFKK